MKFKFFGAEIYVSFLFAATLSFMIVVDKTGLIMPTLVSAAVHEMGHLIAMWATDCQPKCVRLIPASVQIVRQMSPKRCGEVVVAVCGPAANLVLAVTAMGIYFPFPKESVLVFALINLITAAFNMMPVSGLDGGTILTELIALRTDINKARSWVRIITVVFAALVFLAGVCLWASGRFNLSVFIVAVYLAACALMGR